MGNAIIDATKVFGGQTTSFVIRFITSILIARWLGAEGKGLYASLLMVPNMMVSIGELGSRQSIVYYLGRKIYSLDEIFNSALLMIFCLASPLILVCFLIYGSYYQGVFPFSAQMLAVATIPVTFLLKILSGIFLGLNRVGVYSKVSWVPATIELLFCSLLLYFFKFGLSGAIFAQILGSLFTVFYGIRLLQNDVNYSFVYCKMQVIKSLITKGVLFAISLFIIQLNYRIDILLLKSMVSMNEIGIYSVGVSLAEILWQIPSAIAVVILARTATSNSNKQKYKVAQSLRVSLFVMIFVALAASIVFYYFIPIIYGKEYSNSVTINRILLFGVVVFTFNKILTSRIAGHGKPQIAIMLYVPCLVIKVLLNLLFVPVYGINGAAWSSNISYMVSGILILLTFSKMENISLKEIFLYKKNDFSFAYNLVKKIR